MPEIGEIRRGVFVKVEDAELGELWLPDEDALMTGLDFLDVEPDAFGVFEGPGWGVEHLFSEAQSKSAALGATPPSSPPAPP